MTNKALILSILASAIISSGVTAVAINALQTDTSGTSSNVDSLMQKVDKLEQQISQIQNLSGSRELDPLELNSQATAAPAIIQNQREVDADSEQETVATQQPQQSFSERRQRRINEWLARQQPDFRQNSLIEAGFEPEEAQRILQLESKAELDQLNAQYQARRARAQRLQESGEPDFSSSNPIRAELGESGYERYLEANGLSTTAQIGSVIGGSPGDNAGLKAGDNIVSYAGERVFSLRDVNTLTIQGEPGESVLIEVLRDDEPVQITIPRGPIGVNNGRRGFR